MNDLQSLIDRQLGTYCRLNYDCVLKRLVCDDESFYGLQAADVPVGSFDQDPPIFACRFAETAGYENILALANEDGRVAIQDVTTVKTAKHLESFQCHNNAVFDLVWMPHQLNFITVSGDHTACLWDVGCGGARRVQTFSGHSKSVKTGAFAPGGGGVFATGGRDGCVLLWDARAPPRPDAALAGAHASPAPRGRRARPAPRPASVTGLAFRDRATLLSCGECDGSIKAWDLRKHHSARRREPLPAASIPYCGSSAKNGYTNLAIDRAGVRLYASCMDDVIYCFDVGTFSALPERRFVGHENGTFYVKAALGADGRYLVSGSSDKMAYVWNVGAAEPVARLAAHRAEVTCAAWGPHLTLVTCGDDARHALWRVGPEWPEPEARYAGRAEAAPRPEPRAPGWRPAHCTPSSGLKRRAAAPPTPATRRRLAAPADAAPARKTKRCLKDLFAGGDPGEAESPLKRTKLADDENEPRGEERATTPERRPTEDATSGAAREGEGLEWSYSPRPGTSFLTPTKNYEAKSCRVLSPKARKRASASPASPSPPKVRRTTPTRDLPDFVRSGEAPHLSLMSPVKKKQDTTDWLTLLRRGREGERPAATPLSPRENIPPRRGSVDRTPKSNKKSVTLLKYFTVKTKDE